MNNDEETMLAMMVTFRLLVRTISRSLNITPEQMLTIAIHQAQHEALEETEGKRVIDRPTPYLKVVH